MRDVIYTSRAYAMMPVSICLSVYLWRKCIGLRFGFVTARKFYLFIIYTLAESVEQTSTVALTPLLSCDSGTIVLMKSQHKCRGIYSTMAVDITSTLCIEIYSTVMWRKTLHFLLTISQHFLLSFTQQFCWEKLNTFCWKLLNTYMLTIIPHFCWQNLYIFCWYYFNTLCWYLAV